MTIKRTRTVIAVTLSLIMALAYLPCTAFAAEGDETQDIDTLKQAMEETEGIMNQAKTEMDEAKKIMDEAKTAWDKKKEAAETANTKATESETTAANAEKARDDAFDQAKAEAKTAYDDAVTAYNNAKDEYEAAVTDYETKQGDLDAANDQKSELQREVTQLQNDLAAAKEQKETLESQLSDLNAAVETATDQWHADQEAAQAALEQAQADYDEAGYTFINSKIDALGSQFFTLDEMIDACKTYTDAALSKPVTFNGKQISTIADVANDDLFLTVVKSNCTKDNLLFAMDMIDESNTLRQAEGKTVMGVSYQLMGAAIMSNSYSLYSFGHDLLNKNGKDEQGYANTDSFWAIGPATWGNENLAAYSEKYTSAYQPYKGWYDEEKAALQKAVDSGQWPGLSMNLSTRQIWTDFPNLSYETNQAGYGQVGHYLTLKNEEYTTTGAAVTYNTGTVPTSWRGRATQSFNDDTVNSISVSQCRNEINAAFADVEDALQTAQSDVEALESKPQAVINAENAVTANEADTAQAKQQISDITGQIEKKNGQITNLTSQIATLQAAVDTAEETKNSKKAVMDSAATVMNEKEAANTKAQELNVDDPATYEDAEYSELKTLAEDAAGKREQAVADRTAANAAAGEAETAEGQYNTAKTDYDTKKGTYDIAVTNYNTAEAAYKDTIAVDINGTKIVLSKTSYIYNGKIQKPVIKTIDGRTLTAGTDYTAVWSNASSKNVGTYTVTVTGKDGYKGTAKATYKILRAKNTLVIKPKTPTVKYSKLKKKTQTIKRTAAIYVAKNKGKVTYVKASGNKKITINKKNGVVTVKKGLKKGKYKVKVKVTAAGNANYYKITKSTTFTVKVK